MPARLVAGKIDALVQEIDGTGLKIDGYALMIDDVSNMISTGTHCKLSMIHT